MRSFSQLYQRLDSTNKTSEKVDALVDFLGVAPPDDAAWAVYFLVGHRPKRLVRARLLAEWACATTGTPDWLFDECHAATGDLAETIALLLPPPSERASEIGLAEWLQQRVLPLQQATDAERERTIRTAWRQLEPAERFVFNKIVTGEFRVGVGRGLVVRALAEVSGVERGVIAHRLMGLDERPPTADDYLRLVDRRLDHVEQSASRPYPFFLAHPLDGQPEQLGDPAEWLAEWKWDGIRGQLLRRDGETFLWSRGEEPILDGFPELRELADALPPGTGLDGEILPARAGAVLPFSELQRRLGRKRLGKKLLQEVPVVFVAYDVLETAGDDVRDRPLAERRQLLEATVGQVDWPERLLLSPAVEFTNWQDLVRLREESRQRGVEGLMLKRLDAGYGTGRPRGIWWKWKVEPWTIDAVLLDARPGSGRRASLYTDYTFGVWRDEELVPIAKAYSGLDDAEIREVDAFVRQHTVQKFGPVRVVEPELVFELGFEGIRESKRHKSGVAVRFPRMLRWRRDKPASEADHLARLVALLPGDEKSP